MPDSPNSQASRLFHRDTGVGSRRETLRLLSAAFLGISLPTNATKMPAIRVIGVGDTGCQIMLSARSSGLHLASSSQPEFACVTMGQQSSQVIADAQRLNPGIAIIRTVQIGHFGSGGDLCIARAAALKHQDELRALTNGAYIVILVAGLGGGTGSGVSPILAGMAKQSGAQTFAVVVTPFDWEVGRYANAFHAIKALRNHCDYMMALSNQAAGGAMGDDATLEDVIKQQELEGTKSILKLVKSGILLCHERRSSPV